MAAVDCAMPIFSRLFRRVAFAASIAAVTGFVMLGAPTDVGAASLARRHTKLVRSTPAAGETLSASPKSLALWFSEKVPLKVTTVKLTGQGGPVTLGAPSRDDTTADAPVVLTISAPLAPGKYTVAWSVAGDDGHPVKGNFAFTVAGSK